MEYKISICYDEVVEANNEEEAIMMFMKSIENAVQMDFATWIEEHIKVEEDYDE